MPLPNDQLQQALAMAQMGKPTAPSHDPAAVQAQMLEAMMMQQRANDMSYRPPRRMEQYGWGSALTEALRPLVSDRKMKKANEKLAKALGQKGDLERHEAALREYQQGIADAQARLEKDQDFQRQESFKAGLKPPTDYDRYTQDPAKYAAFKEAGRGPGVTVNNNPAPGQTPQEKAQETADLAAIGERTSATVKGNQVLMERGDEARRLIPTYNLGIKLLDNVTTGPFTEKVNDLKKIANSFGADIDTEGVTNYEQLAPIFGKFLFQGIQQTKGAVSNKEMDIFAKMNANYGYTTEGNKRLLGFAKKQAERDVEIRDIVRDMRDAGKSPTEVSRAVDKYIDEHDLSSELEFMVGGEADGGSEIYVNPDTGERIKWDGDKWVPVT